MTKSTFHPAYTKLKQLLIEARRREGLTQQDLADRISRPQSYVSKYERGERRIDLIEFLEIAGALDIDPVTFLKKLRN